jgi:hypothetical protein
LPVGPDASGIEHFDGGGPHFDGGVEHFDSNNPRFDADVVEDEDGQAGDRAATDDREGVYHRDDGR